MEQLDVKRKPNPKRLEKTLFVNHKADQALEKQLATISLTSRLRMMELDRERINLRNEFRLSKRRPLPQRQAVSRASSPTQCTASRQLMLDPVNKYLLSEYRKVGEVIPRILTSLSTKEDTKVETVPFRSQSPEVSVGTDELPDVDKMLCLIKNVKKMRHDMTINKRLDTNRPMLSFDLLMKKIADREKNQSVSDTYTDGACMLLRRKMKRIRRFSVPNTVTDVNGYTNVDLQRPHTRHQEVSAQHHFPAMPMSRSVTSLGSIGRQSSDISSFIKQHMAEEDEFITKTKVSKEREHFDKLTGKVGNLMDEWKRHKYLKPEEIIKKYSCFQYY